MFWKVFTEGFARSRGGCALDVRDGMLTYCELADLVGSSTGILETDTGQVTAIVARKELPSYVAILAASRAGTTVTCLDPHTPLDRQRRILDLLRPSRIVGPDDWLDLLDVEGDRQSWMAPGWSVMLVPETDEWERSPLRRCLRSEPGYIAFTSGSTGEPKGIPVLGSAIMAYLEAVRPHLELSTSSRMSHTFALTFDAGMHDLLVPWSVGAAVCVPRPREHLLVAKYVQRCSLTHWFSVPSVVDIAGRLGTLEPNSLDGLRVSVFGGEALTTNQLRRWRSAGATSVLHLYGPSETTVACTAYRLPKADKRVDDPIPIGAPLTGIETHLVPVVDGDESLWELSVRGVQRFGGYLRNSENDGRFLDAASGDSPTNLTFPVPADLYYRTGDLVRVLSTGDLVFTGRVDDQVKISGYRIELADIEAAAARVDGVTLACAVGLRSHDGAAELGLAYVGDDRVSESVLRSRLVQMLPPYMRPRWLLRLTTLPYGANGKLDRRELATLLMPGRHRVRTALGLATASEQEKSSEGVTARKSVG